MGKPVLHARSSHRSRDRKLFDHSTPHTSWLAIFHSLFSILLQEVIVAEHELAIQRQTMSKKWSLQVRHGNEIEELKRKELGEMELVYALSFKPSLQNTSKQLRSRGLIKIPHDNEIEELKRSEFLNLDLIYSFLQSIPAEQAI